uniref:NB-ARC domain-containing protein n=1 Tax=Manihot esculenta TaxID=3983 RepID=A0A2C9V7A5_MANES
MLLRSYVDCRRLISLPQSIKCLTTLDTLCIDGCEKLDLRMEEGEETLCIDGCENLDLRMEEGEETQFSLQRLELRWLPKILDFPEWLIQGSTNSLEVLEVEQCNSLGELAICLQNMASHPEVRIIDCPELNNNPLHKSDFPSKSIHTEYADFSLQRLQLKVLQLRSLPKIVDFPKWLIRGSTNSLKVLEVERCNNLRELPNRLQNMVSHLEARITDCPGLNNDPLRKAEEAGPSTSLS